MTFAALLGCVALALLSSRSPSARAASVGQLKNKISAGQSRASQLSGVVQGLSSRLATVHSSVVSLEAEIRSIQADLDAKRAELIKLRTQLDAARRRLAQLVTYEQHAEQVLSHQLVSSYEADRPDIVSVVLDSSGFQDLLERLTFAQRVRKQSAQIVKEVRAARRAVAAQALQLGRLETRQQILTAQVLAQRNRLDRTRVSLLQEQISLATSRRDKASQLSSVQGQVADLRGQLSRLQAAQAAAAAAAAARARAAAAAAAAPSASSSGSSGGSSGPVSSPVSSGGGFTFPLPKSAASSPGTWSLDQGVDISAPGGTPEYAVCSGTIVLHGIGGFGPWAPVLACDHAVGGYTYVYYGHAGPANQLPIGTHVGAGQVMSEVGPGIVGISTGPHIEIGFCDSSGSPIGGGSASTMLSLLQGSY